MAGLWGSASWRKTLELRDFYLENSNLSCCFKIGHLFCQITVNWCQLWKNSNQSWSFAVNLCKNDESLCVEHELLSIQKISTKLIYETVVNSSTKLLSIRNNFSRTTIWRLNCRHCSNLRYQEENLVKLHASYDLLTSRMQGLCD